MNSDELLSAMRSMLLLTAEGSEQPAPRDDDDQDYEPEDIVDRLCHSTPCVPCRKVCEDAAAEIERLRAVAGNDEHARDDGVVGTLSEAIFGMDPCGRDDCICPSASFLSDVRSELLRLRKVESRAMKLSSSVMKVWRGDEPASLLIHAVSEFKRA